MLNEKDKKIFKIIVIVAVLILVAVVVKEVFLTPELEMIPETLFFIPNVNVDFEFLESEQVIELDSFEELTLPEEFGRQRPFEPY